MISFQYRLHIVLFMIGFSVMSCSSNKFSGQEDTNSSLTADKGKVSVEDVVDDSTPKTPEEQDRIDQAVDDNTCSNPNATNQNQKVYVCHLPPGQPQNGQTLCLPVAGLRNHLGTHTHAVADEEHDSGDYVGPCDSSDSKKGSKHNGGSCNGDDDNDEDDDGQTTTSPSPNPTPGTSES